MRVIGKALQDLLAYHQLPGFIGVETEEPFIQGRTDPIPDFTIHTETDKYAVSAKISVGSPVKVRILQLVMALLAVLIILAIINDSTAGVIGAAVATVLLAVCTRIAKKLLSLR